MKPAERPPRTRAIGLPPGDRWGKRSCRPSGPADSAAPPEPLSVSAYCGFGGSWPSSFCSCGNGTYMYTSYFFLGTGRNKQETKKRYLLSGS